MRQEGSTVPSATEVIDALPAAGRTWLAPQGLWRCVSQGALS